MAKNWLKYNKWTSLYLLWVCGITIVFSFFVLDLDDRHNLIVYNTLFVILLTCFCLLIKGKIGAIVLVLFSVFALVPAFIEAGWFLIDKSVLIRTQFWVIFDTNPAEARGFLSMIQLWQWALLFCYMIICCSLLVLACRERKKKETCCNHSKTISFIGCLLSMSLVLIPGVRYNVPCINFYNSYRGYYADVQRARNFMLSRQDLSGQVMNNFQDSVATVVVIIGESLNKNHCSLYGYCRQTTPLLDKREDIRIYRNVESPSFMTQEVLQQVLTFANRANPEARWNSPTLPELLNAAGWHTYWFDPFEGKNNTANSQPTGFSSIAKLCTTYHLCDDSEQFDGALLCHLDTILDDTSSSRKAIFFHLIGNHFPYESRYPQNFNFFSSNDICSAFVNQLSSKQKCVINAYDDAVRYNDWVIDSVLNRLCRVQHSCAMLYFSDHGEEIYDYDFYAGRSFNHITRSLYEIPCIFWQNKVYEKSNPLYIDCSVDYCTEDMIHSLLDLFAVSYVQQDTCHSLFRKNSP